MCINGCFCLFPFVLLSWSDADKSCFGSLPGRLKLCEFRRFNFAYKADIFWRFWSFGMWINFHFDWFSFVLQCLSDADKSCFGSLRGRLKLCEFRPFNFAYKANIFWRFWSFGRWINVHFDWFSFVLQGLNDADKSCWTCTFVHDTCAIAFAIFS